MFEAKVDHKPTLSLNHFIILLKSSKHTIYVISTEAHILDIVPVAHQVLFNCLIWL